MSLALTDEHRALADVVDCFLTDQKASALSRAVLDHSKGADPISATVARTRETGLPRPAPAHRVRRRRRRIARTRRLASNSAASSSRCRSFPPSFLRSAQSRPPAPPKSALLPGFVDGTNSAARTRRITRPAAPDGTVSGDSGYVVGGASGDCARTARRRRCRDRCGSAPGVTIGGSPPPRPRPAHREITLASRHARGSDYGRCGAHASTRPRTRRRRGRREAPATAWRWPSSTPRCASSSAASSARSRRSSTTGKHARRRRTRGRSSVGRRPGRRGRRTGRARRGRRRHHSRSTLTANAERNIQIHGGIGFTWEHDCHLFLRRARACAVCLSEAEPRATI